MSSFCLWLKLEGFVKFFQVPCDLSRHAKLEMSMKGVNFTLKIYTQFKVGRDSPYSYFIFLIASQLQLSLLGLQKYRDRIERGPVSLVRDRTQRGPVLVL